ncbi:MAG: hypothetical protein ABRQ38_09150 [Candidatus Eremiobacterota bacterium]
MYRCVVCNNDIPDNDINPATGAVICRNCSAVMASDKYNITENAVSAVPAGLKIEKNDKNIRIIKKWLNSSSFFSLLLGLILFLIVGFHLLLPFMVLFPVILLPILLFLYSMVALLFNSTFIDVTDYELTVSYGPVPWYGGKKINSSELLQFYCEEYTRRRKRKVFYMYRVNAILKENNIKIPIIQELTKVNEALFIEHELEKYFGIKDMCVSGEVCK